MVECFVDWFCADCVTGFHVSCFDWLPNLRTLVWFPISVVWLISVFTVWLVFTMVVLLVSSSLSLATIVIMSRWRQSEKVRNTAIDPTGFCHRYIDADVEVIVQRQALYSMQHSAPHVSRSSVGAARRNVQNAVTYSCRPQCSSRPGEMQQLLYLFSHLFRLLVHCTIGEGNEKTK